VLALAVRSLARQTAAPGTFQVVLVDNASTPPLDDRVLAPLRETGVAATLTREEKPGLTQARLHAIRRTGAPWMLFVDDDNELADDFVVQGLAFAASRPDVGCFGGRLRLPETVSPPRWALPFLPFLGIKDEGDEVITGAGTHWGAWEPAGAGFWIRRDQLESFRARLEADPRAFGLGRTGRSGLASCEDSLMARESRRLGLVNAYVPSLSLRHHLDPARFDVGYLLRLMKGYGRSHVLLEELVRAPGDGPLGTPAWLRGRRFLRLLGSELNAARKKRSLPFVLGRAVYCLTLRSEYRRRERGEA
jgi:glycosyltransferase involved in cell wall biosynthesis